MRQFLLRSTPPLRPQATWQRFLLACTMMVGSPMLLSGNLAAQSVEDSALSLAPEDAAFFSSSLNMRAACNDFVEGQFVQRLLEIPFVNRLKSEMMEQWENPQDDFKQAKLILESPPAVDIMNLFQDMAGNEIFVYGADDWCDAIDGIVAVQAEMSALANQSDNEEAMLEYFHSLNAEDFSKVRIPTTVVGFKLSDDAIARDQLDALEGIVRLGLGSIDEFKPLISKIKRDDFKGGQSLSITLDSSMIPEMDLQEDQAEALEKLKELLDGRSIALAIGLKNNVLLITISENADVLEQVGTNTSSLMSNPSVQYLRENATDELRSIGYVSKRFRESQWTANFGNYFERLSSQFAAAIETAMEDGADLQEWQQDIATDTKWLDSQVNEFAPEFGDSIAWSQAIAGGTEGFMIDWSENQAMENAHPLSIMQHTGSDALMTFGFKQKEAPGLTAVVEYMLERAPVHARRFIELAEDDEESREKAMLVLDKGWPLLQEIFEIASEKLAPALADRESAFAMSAAWTTFEIIPELPPSAQPLPLPEMAWVFKLKDRDQFLEGCSEIYGVIDRVVDLVREIEPNAVPPNYRVPRPDEEALVSGTRYFYPQLSKDVPLEGFEPQLLVGDNAIVLGYSVRQVDDMLDAKPVTVTPTWLTADSPVAAVSYVNFASIVNMIRPWATYAFSVSGVDMDTPLADDPGPVPTPNDLLQIWDTLTELGEAHGSTVIDEGTTVTRWQWLNTAK
jgi:hypothetical protein